MALWLRQVCLILLDMKAKHAGLETRVGYCRIDAATAPYFFQKRALRTRSNRPPPSPKPQILNLESPFTADPKS